MATTLENFLHPDRIDRGSSVPETPDGEGFKGALPQGLALPCRPGGWSPSPCCVLAGQGGSVAEQSISHVWHHDPFLDRVEGMLAGKPLDRCAECSWNILNHEAEIGATSDMSIHINLEPDRPLQHPVQDVQSVDA